MTQQPYPGQPFPGQPAPAAYPPAAPTPQPPQPPAKWAAQVSFFQRNQPAFWLFVITIGITGLIALSKQVTMIQVSPSAWFLTLILLAPYAIPVALFIYFIDMYEREPKGIILAALAWGGIAATTLSLYTNTPLDELIYKLWGADFAQTWGAAVTAPFVEEGIQGARDHPARVDRAGRARRRHGRLRLGRHGRDRLPRRRGHLLLHERLRVRRRQHGGGLGIAMIRILGAGPYSHFLYTGLTGMGIAYYVTQVAQPKSKRLGIGLLLGAFGVGAHFIWNSPLFTEILSEQSISSFFVFVTVKGLPLLIGLVIVVMLARAGTSAGSATSPRIRRSPARSPRGTWRSSAASSRAGAGAGRPGLERGRRGSACAA